MSDQLEGLFTNIHRTVYYVSWFTWLVINHGITNLVRKLPHCHLIQPKPPTWAKQIWPYLPFSIQRSLMRLTCLCNLLDTIFSLHYIGRINMVFISVWSSGWRKDFLLSLLTSVFIFIFFPGLFICQQWVLWLIHRPHREGVSITRAIGERKGVSSCSWHRLFYEGYSPPRNRRVFLERFKVSSLLDKAMVAQGFTIASFSCCIALNFFILFVCICVNCFGL